MGVAPPLLPAPGPDGPSALIGRMTSLPPFPCSASSHCILARLLTVLGKEGSSKFIAYMLKMKHFSLIAVLVVLSRVLLMMGSLWRWRLPL